MHELGRYLQREIDRRGWTIAELARHASLSKQTLYSLINDDRDHMDQTPQRKTVNAIAEALKVDPLEILTASAKALGVPVDTKPTLETLDHISDQQILLELAARLSRSKGQDNASRSQAPASPKRRLRAVESDPDHPRQEQKTEDDEQQPPFGLLPWNADVDTSAIPPIDQVAAHPNFKSKREKWEEQYGERGEESQDPGDDF